MSTKPNTAAVTPADRRVDPRMSTHLQAVIEDAKHGSLAFTASGFSRTGAFLQSCDTSKPMPAVGSTVQLVIHWPLQTKLRPVRVEAKVIRHTDDGIGVQFDIRA